MSSPQTTKNTTHTDTASLRSTSTMSSLKALLPHKAPKDKNPRPQESAAEKNLRREATVAYLSMK